MELVLPWGVGKVGECPREERVGSHREVPREVKGSGKFDANG